MIPIFRLTFLFLFLFLVIQAQAQTESKVYVTKTGAKYHKSSCRYAETGWSASLSEAKDRGLTACLVCKPGGGSSSSTETQNLRSTTPSTTKPAATTSSSQCRATTKANTRCSRKAATGSSYCWQHVGEG